MFKAECKKGNVSLEISGSVEEILADLCTIVGNVNSRISDDDAREFFEAVFKSGMFADLAFASNEEVEAKVKKQREEKDTLKSMIKDLEELAEAIKKCEG